MSSTPNPTSSSPFSSDNKVLFPGYKHVERFGPDGDYEYKRKRKHKHEHKGKGRGVDEEDEIEDEEEEEIEEEECYITLDLSNVDQTLASSCSSYRLVGLDTPTPLFQLSKTKTIMKGQLRTLIGTELIFKHAPNPNSGSGSGPGSEDPNTNTTSNTNTSNTNTSNTNSNIQYFTKTSNRIHFREVLLQPTKAKSGDESNTDEELHAVVVVAAAAAAAGGAGRGTSTTNENTEPESGPAATTHRPSNAAQDTSRSQVSEFVSESQAEQDIQPHNRVGDSLLAVQTYRPMDVD